MTDPLVTIVTSTWQRPITVTEHAIWSFKMQTYQRLQHIIVIDGNDQVTIRQLEQNDYTREAFYPIGGEEYEPNQMRYIELGRNWTSYSGDGGAGAACRLTGAWMAAGDLITYLDDDATYEPQHIEEMVRTFDDETDFVTSNWGGIHTSSCPGPPPGLNRTDTSTIMHRANVLSRVGGFHTDGYAGDGHMVERWLAAGLKWKYKQSVTVLHPTGHHAGGPMPLCAIKLSSTRKWPQRAAGATGTTKIRRRSWHSKSFRLQNRSSQRVRRLLNSHR